jgi:DNA/RNA-binding domain of Phe-tRNA-synthetase-like protein
VDNSISSAELESRKRETEARLRERYQGFTRQDFLSLPVMSAYVQYYKKFSKTYHVLLQLESIVLKGKNLPSVSPLVDANFIAEVDTLALTAGHDVPRLNGSIVFDVSREGDRITQMNNAVKDLHPGDMVMKDNGGICCSILYGQDHRSPISPKTSHALYVVYAPAAVIAEAVNAQLRKIEENVRLFAPSVTVEQRRLITS